MHVGAICKALLTVVIIAHIILCVRVLLSLIVSLSVSKSYSVYCTTETVSGLQQVDLPSHLKNCDSEQASCADEQLYMCEEQGMSLLQLLSINLSISE